MNDQIKLRIVEGLMAALVLTGLWLLLQLLRLPADLDELLEEGELVVLTRSAPTIYYHGRDGYEGPEYDLVQSFAAYLGVKVRFVVMDGVSDILTALERSQGHLAAAGLTRTPERQQRFTFGPDYHTVQQQLVCRRGGAQPRSVTDLVGLDITVIADSSYVDSLERLSRRVPQLRWQVSRELSTEELLEQVWMRQLDCTVADSHIIAVNRRYYPELQVAFAVSGTESLAWALAPGARSLLPDLQAWFAGAGHQLEAVRERYYGHITFFDYVDVRIFIRRIAERLPRYESLFRKAARRYRLPWTLLAAQAYQESHWNPRARSPTGVRGLMMLTLATARQLKVSNRLDPAQSVDGGARYLRHLLERLPAEVVKEDRLWFALAAYNVGLGHVLDARTLARRLGRNPDIWSDLKTVLPLLARRQYHRTLEYGYARGSEPVRYVQRIRDFRDILERWVPAGNDKPLVALEEE